MLVKDVMIDDVFKVNPESSLLELVCCFIDKEIGSVVVVDQQQKPIQIITLRDLPKIFLFAPTPSNVEEVLQALGKDKKSLITVKVEMPLIEAINLMARFNISHLPVVDDNSKLVGLLSLKDIIKSVPSMMYIDHLTGLNNRLYLDLLIPKLKRTKGPIGFIMADIDNFKNINDLYGHLIGDEVLKVVAQTLRKNVKISDEVIRYGGEEFLIILYRCDLDKVKMVGERLRERVMKISFETNPNLKVTISLGGCEYRGEKNIMEYISLADQALYQAKQLGKNRVEVLRLEEKQEFCEIGPIL
ncbi:GGDEF domain-containing protein [Thermodesulfobacterium sp.]|uniref:GGDEF domain-containing protein n=1 Tax=Thermodesulfobacterium sp. TaxID=1965289 RepID=UPI00257F93F9|nr:GGDEF domain-containing protein [Thermodesulfobacterium sp.]MBZ4681784.1 diguanylate cyclase [Thermodesulfobacterium sp.]